MSSFLSMGKDTYQIPLALFQENRAKLVSRVEDGHVVFVKGGPSTTRFDTDHEPLFRQESYFWWLTGVKEPDCAVAIHTTTGHTTLFVPLLPPDYATVMGKIESLEGWKERYQVDTVLYTQDIETVLEGMLLGSELLLLLQGLNTDSGKTYPAPTFVSTVLQPKIDTTMLFPILAECRVIKSAKELSLLQRIAQISSLAHAYVMRHTKPDLMEYQCESLFLHFIYYHYGCRLTAYTNICGCGPNAAILHYGHAGEPNARQLGEDDNCLFDMGAEYQCYASDITCSFPANGTFSEKYKPIYQGVLQAQIAVYNLARPGVSWVDCHKAAEAELLKALASIGLVIVGDSSIEALVEARLGAVFMPHGLGHLLGIDTHDVGGYLKGHPERIVLPGLKSLRTARILQEDMVLTVEPGCYFIDHLLDGALADPVLSQHLNQDVVDTYRGYGGARLEDVVTITKEGLVNFTICPRTITEIEGVMAGGKWPPMHDEAPELRRLDLTKPIPMGMPDFK